MVPKQREDRKRSRRRQEDVQLGAALIPQGSPSGEWTCRREPRRGKSSENKETSLLLTLRTHKAWAWFWFRICLPKAVCLLCLWQSQRVLLPPGGVKVAIKWIFHPSTLRRHWERNRELLLPADSQTRCPDGFWHCKQQRMLEKYK